MGAFFFDALRAVHGRWALRLTKAFCSPRAPFIKRRSLRRIVLLCILAVALICTRRHKSESPPAAARPGVPPGVQCHGDAVCCARLHAPAGRRHRLTNFSLPAALSAPAGAPRIWRAALPAAEPPGAREANARIVRVVRALRAAGPNATLLDLGAGGGRLALAVATAGHPVVAVGALARRTAALRHSLCLARADVQERVTVREAALGARDDRPAVGPRVRSLDGMVAAGEVKFAQGAQVVVNIDAGGFEPFVAEGARAFLEKFYPSAVFVEYCPRMMAEAARGVDAASPGRMGKRLVGFMKKSGFRVFAMYKTEKSERMGQVYEAVFIHKN